MRLEHAAFGTGKNLPYLSPPPSILARALGPRRGALRVLCDGITLARV